MKSCQVAKTLPTRKKTFPVLCWRRMRRKRDSFLPSKSLIKNRAKHSGEEKDGLVPSRHNRDEQIMLHLLLEINFNTVTWVTMWVSQLFNLSHMVLVHVEISIQSVPLHWWGQSSCKHSLGQFSVTPSPYSCTNTAPCFSCQGIRSAETLTCLRLSNITTPRSTKLRERCA